MKKYFGYIRVSTPRQGQGVSLQEQKSAILELAKRQGLSIVEWFEERETAAKTGRDVFSQMLSQLGKRRVEGVIIHKIDRSARNLWDWANLGKLFDLGVDVQFAHESIDLRTRGGRLSADIMAVVAADYVRNLRDEVRKGFYGRLKQGFLPLPAPPGYLDRGAGKPKEIDPIMGPLAREAFIRYATGTISMLDLTEEMNAKGLRTRNGTRFSVNSLAAMLHNPFYIGLIYIRRTNESFQGRHIPLVTRRVFDAVQDVSRGRAPKRAKTVDMSFRGFAFCGECGRQLIAEFKKQKYAYYRCYYPPCRKSVLRETDIHKTLLRSAGLAHLSPDEIGDLVDLARDELARGQAGMRTRDAALRLRLQQCDARISGLTDALLDRLLDKEEYETRKATLLEERRSIADELESPDASRTPAETVLKLLELPDIVEVRYENANPAQKREIAASIAWNLVAHGKEPIPTLKNPYRQIVNWRLSRPVERNGAPQELETKRLYEILKEVSLQDNNPPERPRRLDISTT